MSAVTPTKVLRAALEDLVSGGLLSRAVEKALSKLAAPGIAVIRPAPASTRFGWPMP